MLDERIEKYSDIGDVRGFQFLCKNLQLGIKNKKSLVELRLHHPGTINLNVDNACILLDIIQQEYTIEYLKILEDSIGDDINNFKQSFANTLNQYLITNNVIDLSRMYFDDNNSSYYIERSAIKLRHAVYRNLLFSFGVLKVRPDGGFYYLGDIKHISKTIQKHQEKVTIEQLLNKLQNQREQGGQGEQFVLNWEKIRLSDHIKINDIQQISMIDVCAGYDIASFNDTTSLKYDRFIEVKTYQGNPHFYWSANERKVAELKGDAYYIYMIDIDKISDENYAPIIIQNPIKFFTENINWRMSIESLLMEQL